jgi:hypothetical protein
VKGLKLNKYAVSCVFSGSIVEGAEMNGATVEIAEEVLEL